MTPSRLAVAVISVVTVITDITDITVITVITVIIDKPFVVGDFGVGGNGLGTTRTLFFIVSYYI